MCGSDTLPLPLKMDACNYTVKTMITWFITINDNDKKTVMYLKFHHCVCLQIFATHPSAEHRIQTVAQSEGLSVTWQEGDPCTNLGPPLFE